MCALLVHTDFRGDILAPHPQRGEKEALALFDADEVGRDRDGQQLCRYVPLEVGAHPHVEALRLRAPGHVQRAAARVHGTHLQVDRLELLLHGVLDVDVAALIHPHARSNLRPLAHPVGGVLARQVQREEDVLRLLPVSHARPPRKIFEQLQDAAEGRLADVGIEIAVGDAAQPRLELQHVAGAGGGAQVGANVGDELRHAHGRVAQVRAINSNLFDNQNKSRVDLLRICLNNLELIEEKTTAIIFLKEKDLIEFNYQKGDTEGFVNFPLSLKNISVSIFLVEFKDGIKLSFRSQSDFDVNIFAKKYFNGGGHKNAAGGFLNYRNMDKALDYIKTCFE